MNYREYLKTLQEGFDDNFMKALGKAKKSEEADDLDLEDDRVNAKLKKNLESLVKDLNKQKKSFTEKDYYSMVGKLFDKKEGKRILNHFLRKKILSGEYESANKIMYTLDRKIEKKDTLGFY